jgi:hypothetical protein
MSANVRHSLATLTLQSRNTVKFVIKYHFRQHFSDVCVRSNRRDLLFSASFSALPLWEDLLREKQPERGNCPTCKLNSNVIVLLGYLVYSLGSSKHQGLGAVDGTLGRQVQPPSIKISYFSILESSLVSSCTHELAYPTDISHLTHMYFIFEIFKQSNNAV